MACVFLSAACSINPVLALCVVHWALWAIVELFHCCWENLDPFLLFVFILGNKHAGIFCRCASSTEKIPHSTRKECRHKRRRWKHILKMPRWLFWNDGVDILHLHYQNHCVGPSGSNAVGWGGFAGGARQGPPAAPAPQLPGSCCCWSSLSRKFLPVATLTPLLCFI